MATLFLSILTKFLVFIFLAGIVGSAVVVIVTFTEDGKLLIEKDEVPVRDASQHLDFPNAAAVNVGD